MSTFKVVRSVSGKDIDGKWYETDVDYFIEAEAMVIDTDSKGNPTLTLIDNQNAALAMFCEWAYAVKLSDDEARARAAAPVDINPLVFEKPVFDLKRG